MARRAKALMQHDEVAYLATVDHQQPGLVQQQRTLYSNITQLPLASLSYGVDTSASLVPAHVPGDDPVLHPAVVEHLKLTGTFDRPVSNPVDETFVRRHGHWLLGSESEAKQADHFDTPQERPWYGVPIVAEQVGSMTVLVDRSQAGDLSGLSTAVQDDIAYDAHLLGVPASSKILVDATTNGLSLNFSSLSKEEAAAVTFGVTSTDDLGEQDTGLAGMVIKVNPHTVDQVVDDEGIMRHELTHYLLRQLQRLRSRSGSPRAWPPGCSTTPTTSRSGGPGRPLRPAHAGRPHAPDHRALQRGPVAQLPDLPGGREPGWSSSYGVAKLLDLMRAYPPQYAGADVDALTPKLLRQVYGVTPAQVTDGAWGLLAQFDALSRRRDRQTGGHPGARRGFP